MAAQQERADRDHLDEAGMETSFGFQSVEQGDKQGRVNEVFHNVASRYDLMNDLMSGGLHRVWKQAMVSWLAPVSNKPIKILDVAGGTGDIAFRIAERAGSSAHITVCDINTSMLAVGEERAAKLGLSHQVTFVEGNAESLPFDDAQFDAYTIAFGIRNVPRLAQAVREAKRVLKFGGRFLCLEFSEVDVPILDKVYEAYSFHGIPLMGELVTKDRESYQYLVESIRKFPHQARFMQIIEDAGLEQVQYRNLTGGVAALHSGWKL